MEAWESDSTWPLFSTSIVSAGVRSCGSKVSVACPGGNPQTWWWTLDVNDAVKLKKESYFDLLDRGKQFSADTVFRCTWGNC